MPTLVETQSTIKVLHSKATLQSLSRATGCAVSPLLVSEESRVRRRSQSLPFAILVSFPRDVVEGLIASEFCRKLPFARNCPSRNEIFAISNAKPFAFASEVLRKAEFATVCLRILVAKIRKRIPGARQNSHSHSQLCRCDHSALRLGHLLIDHTSASGSHSSTLTNDHDR